MPSCTRYAHERIARSTPDVTRASAWSVAWTRSKPPSVHCRVHVDELHQPAQDARAQYTPGEFLKQAGMVIAVCLGLAMLAQVLVMIVGEY